MKNILILLFLLWSVFSYSQNSKIYESEQFVTTTNMHILKDSSASNLQYLIIDNSNAINWKIKINDAGWYKLCFRYRAPSGDMAQKLTINGKEYGIGFTICNNWNNAYFRAYLKKGDNNINLSLGYGNVHIDYLSVPTSTEPILPSISPQNSVFYTSHPATLSFYIDAMGLDLMEIHTGDINIGFEKTEYPYVQGAYRISLSMHSLQKIPLGINPLTFKFSDGTVAYSNIQVKNSIPSNGLTLIMFNIEHGNSVLAVMPGGKIILIDSGKESYARSVIMPFLDKNHIDTIHYYIITHYHDDHAGAKDEILNKYHVQHFYDYKSFKAGDTVTWDKALFTFLNTYYDGKDENDRSLSFLLKWNRFTYSHGSDNYAHSQDRILKQFGNKVFADVFYANHHFHGSVNPEFIIKTNPRLVVVSAEQAVYARGAYADVYKEQTEKKLFASHARLIETLLTLEAGTVVIRVEPTGNWWYETYVTTEDIFLR